MKKSLLFIIISTAFLFTGVEGTVKVCFVVDTDGKITDAHVHEGVHPVLDEEAIRVVMKSPKWKSPPYSNSPSALS